MMRRISLLLLLVLFVAGQARASVFDMGRAERLTTETPNSVLHGYRFFNKYGRPNTGPKVLLLHAVSFNFHEFEYLIPIFLEQGYDCYAFNFRGHGNGDERSTVKDYRDGDYGFEGMVQEDFPAMIHKVQGSSGGPVIVVGHSMGGMVPRAALAAKTVQPKDIRALALMGSPSRFQQLHLPGESVGLAQLGEWFAFRGEGSDAFDLLTMVHDADSFARNVPGLGWFAKLLSPLTHRLKRALVGRMAMSPPPVLDGTGAQANWIDKALSRQTPKDIMRAFINFLRQGYPYYDIPLEVPTMHVLSKKDRMVPYEDAVESVRLQSEEAGLWLLTLESTSHMQLVAEDAVETYRDSLVEFLAAPEDVVSGVHTCRYLFSAR